jgi:Tfp pilus assembly protein PilF
VVVDEAIRRCISRLRRLASKCGGFTITTIDRVGYRLDEVAPQAAAASNNSRRRRVALIAAAGLVLLVVGTGVVRLRAPPHRVSAVPADAAIADLYLQARDDWATRTPEGLQRAASELGEVTSRDPSFAPAYAALADVYIAAREYEAMPDSIAFPKAEAAARIGLALDPLNADANRAVGFIDFWERHDLEAAKGHFAASLRSDPDDAQTHFWLANILLDVGDDRGSLGELQIARRLNPGARPIEVTYAKTLWSLDPNDATLAKLQQVAAEKPPLGIASLYLSSAYLLKGDFTAYLQQRERYASLTLNPALTAQVQAERAAFRVGGGVALLKFIANVEPASRDVRSMQAEWPATAASLLGERQRLLELIGRGIRDGERWTSWRADQARFAKWRDDPLVLDGLRRLHALSAA